MSPAREFSRRTLLLAGTGTLAGAAISPLRALAQSAGPTPRGLGAIALGSLQRTRTLVLPVGVRLVGLQWRSPSAAQPQLRVRLNDGTWAPWVSAAAHGHGPDNPGTVSGAVGEPLWTGSARRLEIRSPTMLEDAVLRTVSLAAGEDALEAALALAQPVLDAASGQPPIIARRAWARGQAPPRVAPEYGTVVLGFVHHTDNPNGYRAAEVPAMLRAIYVFHRYVNGWNDIGYNFVIDLYGRIFEARAGGIDEAVVGAQAGGYNLFSSGVAVLGTFSETPISTPARRALERLLAWKLSLHGVPAQGRVRVRVNPAGARYSRFPAGAHISLPRIAGHRDADSTDCPGDRFYGELGRIRRAAATLAGQPVRATLSEVQPAAGSSAPVLRARLELLDGTPLAGETVTLQARTVTERGESVTETTIAEGLTEAQGCCEFASTFAAGASAPLQIRVLYGGAEGRGAAVSPALRVAPQPSPGALTPPEASAPSA